MQKDFDDWNRVKKDTDIEEPAHFRFREGDIWWCKLGLNIGVEIDGKNSTYERPVIIIRKFNDKMLLVLPLTRSERSGKYYHSLWNDISSTVVLSQVRMVSSRRLIRKMSHVAFEELEVVKEKFKSLL